MGRQNLQFLIVTVVVIVAVATTTPWGFDGWL
jgi:hypothetical protein